MEGGFGARVAHFRRRRGLSQRDLAVSIGRSESWMSQVERDVLPVGRLSVLQTLADALDVSMYDLRPAHLEPPPDAAPPPDRAPVEALDDLRAALVDPPGLSASVGTRPGADDTADDTADITALEALVDDAWTAAHRWHVDELGQALAEAVPALEAATRAADGEEAQHLARLLARAYRAAAAAFTQAGEIDAAWVAADRAVAAAEAGDDPAGMVAGLYRMAHAFVRDGRFGQADRVLGAALAALDAHDDDDAHDDGADRADGPLDLIAAGGALRLLAAVAAAREGHRAAALAHLDAARADAARADATRRATDDAADRPPRPGRGRRARTDDPAPDAAATGTVDHDSEFGPANVEAHAVSVAVELGDAGMAIDLAAGLDLSSLSPERRARVMVDVARAYTQRRQVAPATEVLLDADRLAPELVRSHPLVREAVRRLMEQAGDGAPEGLKALTHRTAAIPP
jgi:transcriptional regulator with XRE-family HTH domain